MSSSFFPENLQFHSKSQEAAGQSAIQKTIKGGGRLSKQKQKELTEDKASFMDFSNIQEEMEIPLKRERLCTRF